jgi:peptidyl-tRNA hydrolase, PTH1 family
VLRKPSPEHREAIEKSIETSLSALDLLLAGDMTRAMMKIHVRAPRPKPAPADTVAPRPKPAPADTVAPRPKPAPADTVAPPPAPAKEGAS